MEEIWKDIEAYPGYQVSNKGRVRSHNKVTSSAKYPKRCWKDRIIKPKVGKDKCLRVELWRDGEHNTVLVHRLEAVAFLGETLETSLTVNHKDGNRLNNDIGNLEWVTLGDNIRHGFRTGLYSSCRTGFLLSGSRLIRFSSMSKGSQAIGRGPGYLSLCLKNGRDAKSVDGHVYKIILDEKEV